MKLILFFFFFFYLNFIHAEDIILNEEKSELKLKKVKLEENLTKQNRGSLKNDSENSLTKAQTIKKAENSVKKNKKETYYKETVIKDSKEELDSTSVLNDTLCPRSREEANVGGRQCLRKCRQDSDCISNRKRCLCDGLCGLSCIRPDLNCDLLKPILNGTFLVTGDYFNAKVFYTCDKDFIISGFKERTCQGDGSWSDRPPICTKNAECSQPPVIPHSRIISTRTVFKIDSIVEYSCFVGYDPKGINKIKCEFKNETIQWQTPDFKCIPKSCGKPGEVENGKRDSNHFYFTRRITFSCNEGFKIQGRTEIFCQSNGQWSGPVPFCKPISCPTPFNPKNGRAIFSNLIFESITRFECFVGYELVGPSRSTCNSSGTWTDYEKVFCEPVNCPLINRQENVQIIISIPNELTKNTLTTYSDDLTEDITSQKLPIGTILQFSCAGNSQLNSSKNFSSCEKDGQWSNPFPTCMKACEVPVLENAKFLKPFPAYPMKHGSTFNVICQGKYELEYYEKLPICYNGSWSYIPKCVPESCKKLLNPPKNGIVYGPYFKHGSKIIFECKDGFELKGSSFATCSFGEWKVEKNPECQEVFCDHPGVIKNGRVLLLGHMGSYEYRSYVKKVSAYRQLTYECNKGFLLKGTSGSTCLNGNWFPPELPECIESSFPTFTYINS